MSKTTKGRLSICLVICLGLGITLAISLFYAQILNTISLNTERKGHTATLLQDGRILVAGGENTNGILDSSEIFDPVTETMVLSALLGAARTGHSAILLSSGQVLIAGGSNGAPLSATEIYDPVSNSFAAGPEMNRARVGHTMTVLNDFQILVVGGDAEGTAEIFDPAEGVFTLLESPLNEPRSQHSAVVLPSGGVLIVGGLDVNSAALDSAEIFNGFNFLLLEERLRSPRVKPDLKALLDGMVQIIGGNNVEAAGTMEMFDPQLSAFGARAHVLNNSNTLNEVTSAQTRAATIYKGFPDDLLGRGEYTLTEIPALHKALLVGGVDANGTVLGSALLFQSSPSATMTAALDYPAYSTVTIRGTGWMPLEPVVIRIHQEEGLNEDRMIPTVADESGNFLNTDLVLNDNDIGATMIITAQGQSSGYVAQTSFSDDSPHFIQFRTQGYLPGGLSVAVTWTRIPPSGGAPENGSTTFTSPGPSAPQWGGVAVWPSSRFIYSYPNSFTYSGQTYYLVSASPSSPFYANASNTMVSAYYYPPANVNFIAYGLPGGTSVTVTWTKITPAGQSANGSTTFLSSGPDMTKNEATRANTSFTFSYPATIISGGNTYYLRNTSPSSPFVTGGWGGQTMVMAWYDACTRPAITSQPVSLTKTVGESATFSVTATGPSLTYQWRLDGANLGGATSSSFTIPSVETIWAGTYDVVVTNTCGSATSNPAILTVNKATPTITWSNPADIVYGTALDTNQLNATASVPGSFMYTPASGTVLNAGGSQTLHVDFTPDENWNYNNASKDVLINVLKRPITIAADPQSKVYGETEPAPLTYKITRGSLVGSDGFHGALTRVPGENVGEYAIEKGTLALSDNYDLTYVSANLTVAKRPITVTALFMSRPYGEPDPELPYQITSGSLIGSDTFSGALARVPGEDVGDYPIEQGTLDLGPNYNLNLMPAVLTIFPRRVSVAADAKGKVYGDRDPELTYQITEGSLVGSDTFSGAPIREPGEDVGTYAIHQGTLNLGRNYDLAYVEAGLTISKRPVTATAEAKAKAYGDADPELTYRVTSGSLVGHDAFTGTLARAAGEDVGAYAILQGTLSLGANYDLTYAGANLTITKRSITVTADAKTRAYGDADPELTYKVTSGSLIGHDAFSGALVRAAGEDVGVYAILQGTLALNANYDLNYIGANLTISKRAVTVTADSKTKLYGDPDPALTYQITSGSLASGDSISGALARNPGEAVGSYTITQGSLALNANYDLNYVGANFTISKRAITVTADAKNKFYGDPDPALTYQVTSGSLASGDSFTGALTRNSGESTGSYTITQGNLALSANYDLNYVGANLTVSKRAVTVTADAKTKLYGDPDPALTYQVTIGSLAAGDSFSGALARNPGEAVGSYTITQGTLALNANYDLNYFGANLTISKRAVTVTADAKAKLYGDPDPALIYQVTIGSLAAGDSFSGALARNPGEAVGSYTITQGSLALNANYDLNYVGANLTISKRAVTVTADAKSKFYGDPDPALTYQITNGTLASGDSFAGALSRSPGEAVGTYAVTQGTLALNGNYALTFVAAELAISQRAITVTADAKSKFYGDLDPALTYKLTDGSLVNGDGFSGALIRNAGESVGSYAILQGTLALSGNYSLSYVGANLAVSQRAITVTADAQSKSYGQPDPMLTYRITGGSLANGDAFTGGLTRASGEIVGTYSIVQGSLSLSGNYSLAYIGANLIISARAVTVTADAQNKIYGDPDPTLTYRITDGSLVNGDAFSGFLTRNAGNGVGSYTILQGTLALSGNYTLNYVGANLTISPRTVAVSADAQSKYYGQPDPALTYRITSGSLSNGDEFVGGLTRNTGEDVGSYAIAQGTLALNSNYSLTYTGAQLTISQRAITVTADARNKVYGDPDPALTYQVTNGSLVNGDIFTGGLARDVGEAKGIYPIGQGSLVLSPNYTLTFVGANLTISLAPLTVTPDDKTKPYGEEFAAFTGTIVGIKLGDNITATYASPGAAASATVAGSPYEIAATLNDPQGKLSNYDVTLNTAKLTIDKTTPEFSNLSSPAIGFGATPTSLSGKISHGTLMPTGSVSITLNGVTQTAAIAVDGTFSSDFATGSLTVPGSPYSIVFRYTGDGNFNGAPEGSGSLTLEKITPEFSNMSSPTISFGSTPTKLSGKISRGSLIPTGNVSITLNGVAQSAVIAGDGTFSSDFATGTLTVPGSPYAVVFRYLGDNNFNASPDGSGSVSVEKIAPEFSGLSSPSVSFGTTPTKLSGKVGHGALIPTGSVSITLNGVTQSASIGADGTFSSEFTTSSLTVPGSPYAITYRFAGDPNFKAALDGSGTLTVTLAAVTTAVSASPNPQQYSDKVTFEATLTPGKLGGKTAATTVTFKLGTQVMGSGAVTLNYNAATNTLSGRLENVSLLEPSPFGTAPTGQMAPGPRTVTAEFGGVDSENFTVTNPTTTLTINPEDAVASYTGAVFASTTSVASSVAIVTLSATIQDITAADPASDPYAGDIRKATVTFVNRDTNTPIGTAGIGLVNPADPKTGTVTLNWTAAIAGDSQSFTIGIIVNNYYTRNSSDDDTVVTVSKPLGTNFITGGGYLLLANSAGALAGTPGTKNNFGFNVKYNKKGTNLQGSINIIIRRKEADGTVRVYQVKGNSMTSLSVNIPNNGTGLPATAVFNGKASIQDITNPLLPISIDGNATLQVNLTDRGEPGGADTIGITVWNKSGGLYFSSGWTGSGTFEQLIAGGNQVVR